MIAVGSTVEIGGAVAKDWIMRWWDGICIAAKSATLTLRY